MNWFDVLKTRSRANTGGGSKRGGPTKWNRKKYDSDKRRAIKVQNIGGDDEGWGHTKTGTARRKIEEDLVLPPEIDEEE